METLIAYAWAVPVVAAVVPDLVEQPEIVSEWMTVWDVAAIVFLSAGWRLPVSLQSLQ